MISIIAAISRNGVIGKDGRIPWNIPEDLAYFKKVTMEKTVIMGRKTYESIGKPLSGRQNIVVSSHNVFYGDNCITVKSFSEALRKSSGSEIFICGGYSLYKDALKLAQKLYLTEIDADFDGDTFFPYFDKDLYNSKVVGKYKNLYCDTVISYSHVVYTKKTITTVISDPYFDEMTYLEVHNPM